MEILEIKKPMAKGNLSFSIGFNWQSLLISPQEINVSRLILPCY